MIALPDIASEIPRTPRIGKFENFCNPTSRWTYAEYPIDEFRPSCMPIIPPSPPPHRHLSHTPPGANRPTYTTARRPPRAPGSAMYHATVPMELETAVGCVAPHRTVQPGVPHLSDHSPPSDTSHPYPPRPTADATPWSIAAKFPSPMVPTST